MDSSVVVNGHPRGGGKMHKKSTSTLPFVPDDNKGGGKKWRLKKEEEPSPPSPFDYPNVQRHKKPFSLGGNNDINSVGGGKTHKKSKQPSEKPLKSTLPFFLQPDNEDIHIVNMNAPKCPGEFHSFYNKYRSDLVDKDKEHIQNVGGQMITIKDRDLYSHVGVSSDSRNVIFKVQKESLYIPAFKAKPKGGEEMQWHEFEMPTKRLIPGAITLPYTVDYTSIQHAAGKNLDELLFGPSMSMADCIDGLSQFDPKSTEYVECIMKLLIFVPECGRFGGLVKKLANSFFYSVPFDRADAALLREWGRLSRLQIYFYKYPSRVREILDDVDLDGILRFIDETVSVLKTLTFEGNADILEVTKFCHKFKDDMLKPGENLYKILVECR